MYRPMALPGIVACLLYYAPHRDSLRFLALGLFLLGMASDAVDGFLARRYHQRTELGTILDPIADKCLILGTLISCSAIRGLPLTMKIPAWFNVVVISRDAVLIVGTLLLFALRGQWNVQPSRLGKWTTFLQMLVIPTVLLGLTMKTPLLILAATLTVLSGMSYFRVGIRLLD